VEIKMVILNGNIQGEYGSSILSANDTHPIIVFKLFGLIKIANIFIEKQLAASNCEKNKSKNKQRGVSEARSSNGASLGLAN